MSTKTISKRAAGAFTKAKAKALTTRANKSRAAIVFGLSFRSVPEEGMFAVYVDAMPRTRSASDVAVAHMQATIGHGYVLGLVGY